MLKISIIVPVYNVEPYLRRCLDSLVNQTLKDIEIICVNDCSPDNSLAILKEYAAKDKRVKIINFRKNKGVSAARNAGLKIAKGKYIGTVDSDDYVDLNFYEKLYENAFAQKADIAHGAAKVKNSNSSIERIIKLNKCDDKEYYFSHPFAIYRTKMLKDNRIKYPEKAKHCMEDICFALHARIFANKTIAVKDIFYHVIINLKGSGSKTLDLRNSLLPPLFVIDLLNKHSVSKTFYTFFFNHILQYFCILQHFTKESIPILEEAFIKYCSLCKYPECSKKFFHLKKYANSYNYFKNKDFKTLFKIIKETEEQKEYPFGPRYIIYPKISINSKNLKQRKIYIWGAGIDLQEALAQTKEANLKIEAILDSKSKKKTVLGYKIIHPKELLAKKVKNYFIIISSRNFAGEIAEICKKVGLKEGVDFWRPR